MPDTYEIPLSTRLDCLVREMLRAGKQYVFLEGQRLYLQGIIDGTVSGTRYPSDSKIANRKLMHVGAERRWIERIGVRLAKVLMDLGEDSSSLLRFIADIELLYGDDRAAFRQWDSLRIQLKRIAIKHADSVAEPPNVARLVDKMKHIRLPNLTWPLEAAVQVALGYFPWRDNDPVISFRERESDDYVALRDALMDAIQKGPLSATETKGGRTWYWVNGERRLGRRQPPPDEGLSTWEVDPVEFLTWVQSIGHDLPEPIREWYEIVAGVETNEQIDTPTRSHENPSTPVDEEAGVTSFAGPDAKPPPTETPVDEPDALTIDGNPLTKKRTRGIDPID